MSNNQELTETQVEAAFKENVVKFPRVEKLPIDPPLAGQNWSLFSFKFLPKPVGGVYGFLKFRGAFPTEDSWEKHAKNIIRSVDSKHKIWPFEYGKWMPITDNTDYAADTLDVSQQEELKRIYNQQESEEAKQGKKQVREVQERVQKLKEEAMRKEVDNNSIDYYAQQIMKKEQLESWLEQVRERKRTMLAALDSTQEEIDRLDSSNPEYADQVDEKIKEIKDGVGLE
jgi:hypothetical protein